MTNQSPLHANGMGRTEMMERVARAICAESASDFCRNVGGTLGCKVGRGEGPHWSKCVASEAQLSISSMSRTACAALRAMREPTPEAEESE